ncbi:LysM peptidoglycan-binding domain-containing protein [Myxococcus sp. RHSTA-1-4]|uniref:LysM peptidoglycan-binding domain-containing protein n=1 Tax=Myxococcus sp. RHSTA-1-4 TaxID=2874601 RepID=UPI001CBDA231|nr:LysM peptidoglycan-binding domain-containing protein [Myxococcus sp. RHSTA-1-4]MBZ4418617.1 LysM peptidoglycan-binding domain-containing protein [Myxococcus sp. RHSTA-1-4]
MSSVSSHRVRSGDTLSTIARNNGVTVAALAKANNIQNADRIREGQLLKLPDRFDTQQTQRSGRALGPSAGEDSFTPTRAPVGEELGSLSRRHESNGNPATVSSGKGDKGGVSYGAYQFESTSGSVNRFVASLKDSHPQFYQALAGKKPATEEFNAAWKELARKDPQGFLEAQHDAVQGKYYEVAAGELHEKLGLDVGARSKALRDVVWSTAVQHGPHGADDIFKAALKGRSPSQVSDEELIQSVYAERGRRDEKGVLVHFQGSSPKVQKGVADRFVQEARDALAMLAKERTGGAPAASPAPPAPTAPSASRAQTVQVPFYSQYEAGHGFTPGDTSCFKAATAMAAATGARVTGPDKRIQVATSENGLGQITVNPEKAREGRSYIDSQLSAGKPVVVGVSHKDASYNADGLTDHFVVITGKGQDAQGRTYYTFHDPGTRHTDKGSDANPNNRFYVDDSTGKMFRAGTEASGKIITRRYEVSMVRPNA